MENRESKNERSNELPRSFEIIGTRNGANAWRRSKTPRNDHDKSDTALLLRWFSFPDETSNDDDDDDDDDDDAACVTHRNLRRPVSMNSRRLDEVNYHKSFKLTRADIHSYVYPREHQHSVDMYNKR